MRDSNPRHPACKAGALPTELTAHSDLIRPIGPVLEDGRPGAKGLRPNWRTFGTGLEVGTKQGAINELTPFVSVQIARIQENVTVAMKPIAAMIEKISSPMMISPG